MANKLKPDAASGMVILPLVLLNGIIIKNSFTGDENWWWLLLVTMPLLLLILIKNRKRRPAVVRRSPLVRRPHYSFDTDQDEPLIRRHEQSVYLRFKFFPKSS